MNTDSPASTTTTDTILNHLPALWVAGVFALGGSTLASLQSRLESPQAGTELPAPVVSSVSSAWPVPPLAEPSAAVQQAFAEQTEQTADVQPFPLEIGMVERVIDGDTYAIRLDRTESVERVRLAWLDTPERGQPFGDEASEWANASLIGRRVVLTVQDRDAYGRLVAQLNVQSDGQMWDVAASLARIGLGWVDPRYSEEENGLHEDQALARSDRVGLWSQPSPVPPWEWRRMDSSDSDDLAFAAR